MWCGVFVEVVSFIVGRCVLLVWWFFVAGSCVFLFVLLGWLSGLVVSVRCCAGGVNRLTFLSIGVVAEAAFACAELRLAQLQGSIGCHRVASIYLFSGIFG